MQLFTATSVKNKCSFLNFIATKTCPSYHCWTAAIWSFIFIRGCCLEFSSVSLHAIFFENSYFYGIFVLHDSLFLSEINDKNKCNI